MDYCCLSANNEKNAVAGESRNNISYGIGGIRGIFGKSPITLKHMVMLGQAIGCLLKTSGCQMSNAALIICDTRESCEPIKEALSFGLSLQQIQVFNAGLLPTPAALPLLTMFPECGIAVVISASHNTFEYNGIKLFNKTGKIDSQQIQILNQYFSYFSTAKQINVFMPPKTNNISAQAHNFYVQHLVQQFSPNDFTEFSSVILDCANGVASLVAPNVFAQLGIKYQVICNHPDGQNINYHAGSTFPQTLSNAVKANNATIGFAFDGDADRVIAADFNGKIKDGDDFLAVLSNVLPTNNNVVVGTIMSNSGLENFLTELGKTFIRADVGEVNLISTASAHGAVLAGEPSGHILFGSSQASCDGIMVALACLKTLQATRNLIFNTYNRFFSQLNAIAIAKPIDLHNPQIGDCIELARQELGVGRILVRCSETEPLVRVLVEAQDHNLGKQISTELIKKLAVILGKVD